MLKYSVCVRSIIIACAAATLVVPALAADDLASALQTLREVGPRGEGNPAAAQAWQQIAEQDAAQLTTILAGMQNAGPRAANWFRTAVDAIAERELAAGRKLPQADLEGFVLDREQAPKARRIAFEWLAQIDPTAPDRLIPGMLDDPSLELRYDAVARQLQAAEKLKGPDAVQKYRHALDHARDLGQIKTIVAELKKREHEVDVAKHMGFLATWHIIGPFDNTEGVGFDASYPPEREIDFEATYEGKSGPVSWKSYTTDHAYGIVDLTKALDKHKGAVAYAAITFDSSQARDVELRLGSINANKVWLNGQLIQANNVYHAGMEVDQYIGQTKLQPGKNTLLVKICQNEQKESWAQRWQFQLRVTDALGGRIAIAE